MQRIIRTSRCCSSSSARLTSIRSTLRSTKSLAEEKPTSWKLKAYKYYYIPLPPIGLAGIVVEPTPDLLRLQQKIIDAVTPFTVKAGTSAAFMSTENGRDIQKFLIDYVDNFVKIASGKKFNPHVTIGVATIPYLKKMLAEPFETFTFSPAGASVYQLGSFGTARKELKALVLTPQGSGKRNELCHRILSSLG